MGGMDLESRKKILSNRVMHEAVRSVARKRGMPPHDVDDILDSVVEDAMDDPNLPEDPEEATKYLCACGRNKSIDQARSRMRRQRRETPADSNEAAPGAGSPEDAAFAARLVREGQTRFPRTFPWFWRTTMGGESHVNIAVELNVSPGHVRHEVYRIRRSLQGLAVGAAAFAVLVVALRWYRTGASVTPDTDLATTASTGTTVPSNLIAPPRPPFTPAENALAFRTRAQREFDKGEWDCAWPT